MNITHDLNWCTFDINHDHQVELSNVWSRQLVQQQLLVQQSRVQPMCVQWLVLFYFWKRFGMLISIGNRIQLLYVMSIRISTYLQRLLVLYCKHGQWLLMSIGQSSCRSSRRLSRERRLLVAIVGLKRRPTLRRRRLRWTWLIWMKPFWFVGLLVCGLVLDEGRFCLVCLNLIWWMISRIRIPSYI